MDVVINKNTSYRVEFHHNQSRNISGVTIHKNGKFIANGQYSCEGESSYCKNCCRKGALTNAFSFCGVEAIPREHRYKIWEKYRTLPKTAGGKTKSRWPKATLHKKKDLVAA